MSARPQGGRLLLLVVCLAHAGLGLASLSETASTYDEGAHLSAGYAYWRAADWRLNPEHPPLAKLLCAAPLLFAGARFDAADPAAALARQWDLGHLFLYRWNDAQRVLTLARLPAILVSTLLCAAIFLWARREWGVPAGSVALILAAFDPNLLAHGRLVTTDVPLTLFFFASVAAARFLTLAPSWPRAALLGLLVGLALATKFSALLLLGLVPLLLAIGLEGPGRIRRVSGYGAVVLLCAGAVIWVAYGLHSRAPIGSLPWETVLPADAPGRAWVEGLRASGLLPEPFVYGYVLFRNMTALKPAFLLGQVSIHGWWYYFPVVALVKTSLPVLLLLLLSAGLLARSRGTVRAEAFLIVPPLLYLAAVLVSSFNIGFRHLLPAYPFLWILAGRCAGVAWPASLVAEDPGRSPRRLLSAAVVALLAWQVAATLRLHPHYLSYFNALGGGPENGYRLLVDSNLDWGQDLPALRREMEVRGIPLIKLSYFGSADPSAHGVPHELLPSVTPGQRPAQWASVQPGDWVAVSATNLAGLYLTPEAAPLITRLRRLPLQGQAGYSILLYRADFAWEGPGVYNVTEDTNRR